jgi:hypothetical protein
VEIDGTATAPTACWEFSSFPDHVFKFRKKATQILIRVVNLDLTAYAG